MHQCFRDYGTHVEPGHQRSFIPCWERRQEGRQKGLRFLTEHATMSLTSVDPQFWDSLTDLQTPATMARGTVIGLKVLDPRLKYG